MNIGHVGHNGGVSRGADRTTKVDGDRERRPAASADEAAISRDGMDARATYDALVQRAGADEPQRADKVQRAMERLLGGDLDRPEVYRDVASRLVAGDFRTV